MSAGIDYSRGLSNIDRETGIRFGVISQADVMQAWSDLSEAVYGEPTCQKCGGECVEYDAAKHEQYEQYNGRGCADYACEACELTIDSEYAVGDEAQGWKYDDDGYLLHDAFDNTQIFVIKSPFYTKARFCSPCAPGAGNLDSIDEDGVETYCLGHDWFEDEEAPYPVYDVKTKQLVSP